MGEPVHYRPAVAPLVHMEGVEKRYGELRALKDVTLSLEEGRIGLLGPNGAGKSTFLKVLLGLLPVDHGTVRVFDKDVSRDPFGVRTLIGYMPEGDTVLPELNALEFTTLAAEMCGLPRSEAIGRAHQVLHYVGLGEARYRKLGSFSTGMRQRARLAQALVGDPKLLLLDEPTSGLDPRGREEMLALIVDIKERTGASVLLSTHILPDVERTCEQVIVVAGGEVLYAGELSPLVASEKGLYEVRVKGNLAPLRRAMELEGRTVTEANGALRVQVPDGASAEWILRIAVANEVQIRHVAPLVQTLEGAFLRTLDEAGERARGADGGAARA